MSGQSLLFIFLFLISQSLVAIDPQLKSLAEQLAETEVAENNFSEKSQSFQSPAGTTEQCVALKKIPGGDYSKGDRSTENLYCGVSMYQEGFASCPKTWSTSPGTMIYDLYGSNFRTSSYESSNHCGQKNKGHGVKTFVKFKNTMNAPGTSGTLSQASLLYYHFSRYFDTKVRVPVAVYREIDKDVHLKRVSRKGVAMAQGKMIRAGWQHLVAAETNPSSYSPIDDIFTDDQKKIYGVMLRGKGERYGTELNGTRTSGWGKGQNLDFQKTPAFLALRSPLALEDAVVDGLRKASRDSKMRPDLVGINELQMLFWMRELTEITLLDYIFSQQDRIGNIDYRWYWSFIENGKVKYKREKRKDYEEVSRRKMDQIPVPVELAAFNPILIQKTQLNDNDAAGRVAYANFAKTTGMLENLNHYSGKVYKRLMALDRDLQTKGPIYQWLVNDIDLTSRRINQIVKNTSLAANIIRDQCYKLKFDLDDVDNFPLKGYREIPNIQICN